MTHQKIVGSIYDYPHLYDVLFSDLCRWEVKFLNSIFERFNNKKEVRSIFEPACGSGRLLYHLAKLGYDVVGLDLNPHSVNYCNHRLKRHNLQESAHIGNMASFTLAELGRTKKFDAAFNFVSSFLHLTTESDAINHLRSVADVLNPGGLYLLGIHLKPKGKQYCSQERYSVRRGTLSVKSHLKIVSQDLKNRIEQIEMQISAETPTKRYRIVDRFPFRIYSAEQFDEFLSAASRFDILATYSFDYDISQPIVIAPDTEDVVYVLRKRKAT